MLGLRAGVGDHERRAGLGARVGQRRVGQRAHVVDHRRAGVERRARHRRAPGVHRHRDPGAGQPLDHRHHAARSPPRRAPARGRCGRTRRPRRSARRRPPRARARCAASASGVRSPGSENESGPAFTMPMRSGRPGSSSSVRSRRRSLTRSPPAPRSPRAGQLAAARGPPPAPPRARPRARRSMRASSQPSSAPIASATARGPAASGAVSSRAASRPSRVRRSSTSRHRARLLLDAPRTAPRPARSGSSGTIRRAELGRAPRPAPAPCARRGRSGRPAARATPRPRRPRLAARPGSSGHPERDLLRAAGRLAALALHDPVHGQLGHPPPGGELAAGDRHEARAGLVQLGLARDVHRLLRVAGRDQRPHARVGAGQVGLASARCRRTRWSRRAGTRCRPRPAARGRAGPRSRCRSCRSASGRARAARRSCARRRPGTIAPASTRRVSRETVTCVPRLGRMRGTSSSA